MRVLTVQEAVAMLKQEVEALPNLKASEAMGVWKVTLWVLGKIYPNFAVCEAPKPRKKARP